MNHFYLLNSLQFSHRALQHAEGFTGHFMLLVACQLCPNNIGIYNYLRVTSMANKTSCMTWERVYVLVRTSVGLCREATF